MIKYELINMLKDYPDDYEIVIDSEDESPDIEIVDIERVFHSDKVIILKSNIS